MSSSETTTDHDKIRKWVEARKGHPATVSATGDEEDPGILRIDFDYDGKDPNLTHISWEEFFKAFDENKLAFLYQDQKADGSPSTFFKFVRR